MSKLKHPSVLSFTRSHDVSTFPFYGVVSGIKPLFDYSSDEMVPVEIARETIRGAQAAAATKESDRGVPNIQRVDFAVLPHGTDALLIEGNLKVSSNALSPHTCNDEEFKNAHRLFMNAFIDKGGMRLLAERYVMNLVNGAILFRNQLGSNIRCAVRTVHGTVEVSRERDLAPGIALTLDAVVNSSIREQLAAVVDAYAAALSGITSTLHIDIRAYAVFGSGQEVYPSQEFADKQDKGEGRVLARASRRDIEQAAFHGRKVGNALRTIDTWYPGAGKPLPAEPFTPDQATQTAMRGARQDFYHHMLNLSDMTQQLDFVDHLDDALYTVAVFIRGGVFSKKGS